MSNGRRYREHEVRQILDLAIIRDDAPVPSLPTRDGLTLDQLQEIGQGLGVSPHRISEAVAAFEARGELLPRTRSLGLPTTVGSIVALPRQLTDFEWDRLIAELRTTFGEKGTATSQGSLREWSHGTLHVFVEPTGTGYRLRQTDSRAAVLGGGIFLGGVLATFGTIMLIALLSKDATSLRLLIPLIFGLSGGGIIAASMIGLPRWAREQEQRMEHLSNYCVSLFAAPASDSA